MNKEAEEIWDKHFKGWTIAGQIKRNALAAMEEYANKKGEAAAPTDTLSLPEEFNDMLAEVLAQYAEWIAKEKPRINPNATATHQYLLALDFVRANPKFAKMLRPQAPTPQPPVSFPEGRSGGYCPSCKKTLSDCTCNVEALKTAVMGLQVAPLPTKQKAEEWREQVYKQWLRYKTHAEIVDWIEQNVIAPLQLENTRLQEQLKQKSSILDKVEVTNVRFEKGKAIVDLQTKKEEEKPYCPACNAIGVSHCASPEYCGNVVYPTGQATLKQEPSFCECLFPVFYKDDAGEIICPKCGKVVSEEKIKKHSKKTD